MNIDDEKIFYDSEDGRKLCGLLSKANDSNKITIMCHGLNGLKDQFDKIAKGLLELGVEAKDNIAFLVERSECYMFNTLAVLSIGCCYVPLDDALPDERLKFMMDDSNATGDVSKSEKFKLENVCRTDFLSQTVSFEFPIKVGEDTAYITQNVISLKNLGEFYQLLSDDRLPSLLERLMKIKKKEQKETRFGYSELMGELASYDIHRSRIFKAIHLLEKYVVSNSEFKTFLDDPKDERFYIKNDKTQDPKRNNFNSLLGLLEEGDIHAFSKEERELIISIRNAFSHNHYKISLDDIAEDSELEKATLLNMMEDDSEDKKKELTTIATLIAKKLEELQKKVEKYKS